MHSPKRAFEATPKCGRRSCHILGEVAWAWFHKSNIGNGLWLYSERLESSFQTRRWGGTQGKLDDLGRGEPLVLIVVERSWMELVFKVGYLNLHFHLVAGDSVFYPAQGSGGGCKGGLEPFEPV